MRAFAFPFLKESAIPCVLEVELINKAVATWGTKSTKRKGEKSVSGGYPAESGGVFGCHSWGEGRAVSASKVAAKCPVMPRLRNPGIGD